MIKLRSEQLIFPTWILALLILIIVVLGVLDIRAHIKGHTVINTGTDQSIRTKKPATIGK